MNGRQMKGGNRDRLMHEFLAFFIVNVAVNISYVWYNFRGDESPQEECFTVRTWGEFRETLESLS